MSKLSDLGEFGLIELVRNQVHLSSDIIKGIGDDTAVVAYSKDRYLLLTTDMLIEGTHFTKKTPSETIGYKALACNVSDIAAMGGVPKYALVSLGVSGRAKTQYVRRLYRGIETIAKKFNIIIVGGDTVQSKRLTINIALTGEVKKNKLITRSGAKEGDYIFVTGPLGGSLKSGWHMKFIPRLRESQFLVKKCKPTAMIDISDGLAADLTHILKASKVGAVIHEDRIPKRDKATLKNALYDGEDFELIFTLPARKARKLLNLRPKPFRMFHIGKIVDEAQELTIATSKGLLKRVPQRGYKHF